MAGEKDNSGFWGKVVSALLAILGTLMVTGYVGIRSDMDRKADKAVIEVQLESLSKDVNNMGRDMKEVKEMLREHQGK